MEENTRKKIGMIILTLGVIITFAVMAFYPAENRGAGEFVITGVIIATARSIYDCETI